MLQWVSCSVVRRRGGRNCFCVWRVWRTVICLADSERLPEGRSLNNLCPGCEGSAVIFPARFLTGGVQVLDGGQVGTDDLFCRPDCPLESVLIQLGGRSKPDSDGCAQNRLYDCGVEHAQQILRQVVLPKPAQEVHPLLGLLDDGVDVGFPLQIPGDCGSQKPEGFHSQHSTVVYDEGGQCWGAPPEVHCHLHGFERVQLQVVATAPQARCSTSLLYADSSPSRIRP